MLKTPPAVRRVIKANFTKDELDKMAPPLRRAASNFKYRPSRVEGLDDNWKKKGR